MPGFTDKQIMHIPLTDFTIRDAQTLTKSLEHLMPYTERSGRLTGKREGQVAPETQFAHIISELWVHIVKPVLDALAITNPLKENLPRIWWCPTGPLAFLPIHAAGIYGENESLGSKLTDLLLEPLTLTFRAISPRKPGLKHDACNFRAVKYDAPTCEINKRVFNGSKNI
ncbi:hypothetical protein B0H14DRAFT_2604238 [Mycena olivaceomarginata]|nr:hypothetical protein B0H14DRAFT_2655642 [Mycena olivaceomarginata]KAJ7814263.1 hypothetical protein B0H14DRAFT_2604238 [Mycena olivaceomarginata]